MTMAIHAGTYKARATGETVLGTSKNKGTPFLEFYLAIIGGENAGGLVRWTGYFTENTNERSIQSLQTCGWEGEDLSEFADGGLHGLDANEVDIVVEIETYQNAEGEERSRPRVAWINRAGGYLNRDAAMNEEMAKTFGDRMRGLVMKMREKAPKGDGADFKFGANAPATPPQTTGSVTQGGRKAF
jgi:hypothetical protein